MLFINLHNPQKRNVNKENITFNLVKPLSIPFKEGVEERAGNWRLGMGQQRGVEKEN